MQNPDELISYPDEQAVHSPSLLHFSQFRPHLIQTDYCRGVLLQKKPF